MKRGREVGTRVSRSENRQSDGKVKVSCSNSQRKRGEGNIMKLMS